MSALDKKNDVEKVGRFVMGTHDCLARPPDTGVFMDVKFKTSVTSNDQAISRDQVLRK